MSGKKRKLRRVNQLQAVGILIAVALLFVGYWYYSAPRNLKEITFVLPDQSRIPALQVQIADSNTKRQKGLMFVKKLPPDQGMLFVYPAEGVNTFWMKNTYISLDMIFMDASGKIVGILHDVPPLNTRSRDIKKPSKYVLELNAGRARALGLTEGSTLVVPDGLPQASS